MKDDRSAEWPPLLDKRQIQDMVHGPISLFYPLDRIVDTREFQRLRDLKQLGVTHLVYPCSTHSRFVHSLGTYWLAFKFVENLKRDTSLNISGQDHLCVSLAALCHDLGHGPFSHLFDGVFRDASRAPKYTHESLSIRLLRRIVNDKEIRDTLEQYLGKGEDFEMNMTFTEELISSQKFVRARYFMKKLELNR
ncbi:Deoxynucleoside triphosphate triphosphohydrolase SAMHD1 [Trichostrongylus colubriformis]|uniref:Deoxynucleoside triphosphate triphosphohydrolase SAMHD1 n=1 Tax=Trichostrongylus colubriformis TaxID=6319 RepID=A0AAN8FBV5_TRICO